MGVPSGTAEAAFLHSCAASGAWLGLPSLPRSGFAFRARVLQASGTGRVFERVIHGLPVDVPLVSSLTDPLGPTYVQRIGELLSLAGLELLTASAVITRAVEGEPLVQARRAVRALMRAPAGKPLPTTLGPFVAGAAAPFSLHLAQPPAPQAPPAAPRPSAPAPWARAAAPAAVAQPAPAEHPAGQDRGAVADAAAPPAPAPATGAAALVAAAPAPADVGPHRSDAALEEEEEEEGLDGEGGEGPDPLCLPMPPVVAPAAHGAGPAAGRRSAAATPLPPSAAELRQRVEQARKEIQRAGGGRGKGKARRLLQEEIEHGRDDAGRGG
jgi:hypothetical protein